MRFTKGFSKDKTEIPDSCFTKHYKSKKNKALQDNKDKYIQQYLEHLQTRQLIDICKNNNIYWMTRSKKADIIAEILKYKDAKI